MSGMALWRLRTPGGARLARGRVEAGPEELLRAGVTIDGLLGGPPGALADTLAGSADGPVPAGAVPAVPVDGQEV
jgi:hypothetical protein